MKKIGFFKNLGSKLKFGLKKTIKMAIPFTVLRIGKTKWSNCNFFKKPVKKDLEQVIKYCDDYTETKTKMKLVRIYLVKIFFK